VAGRRGTCRTRHPRQRRRGDRDAYGRERQALEHGRDRRAGPHRPRHRGDEGQRLTELHDVCKHVRQQGLQRFDREIGRRAKQGHDGNDAHEPDAVGA